MYVAAEIGFWRDPRTLRFCEVVKQPPIAGGFILQWREFLFMYGDKARGTLKGYSIADVALAIGFPGKPAVLLKALKDAEELSVRKRTFFHPRWHKLETGKYLRQVGKDRDRQALHRKRLKDAREAAEIAVAKTTPEPSRHADVTGTTGGGNADNSVTSDRYMDVRAPSGAPTDSPQGGEGVAYGWKEFWESYPPQRRRNQDATRRRFNDLTHDQRVGLGVAFPRHLSIWRGKNSRRVPFSDVYLRDERWAEMLRDRTPTLARPKPAAAPPDPEAERRAAISDRRMARLIEIKEQLRVRGVHRSEIQDKAIAQLEREWPEDVDEPLPAASLVVLGGGAGAPS